MTDSRKRRRRTLYFVPILLCACVFETEDPVHHPTQYDLSRLQGAVNPLSKWYAFPQDNTLVGLQFAFTTMNYGHETDTSIESFHRETGRYPVLAGAYFDFTVQPAQLDTFLQAVLAKGCIPYVTLDPKEYANPDFKSQTGFIGRINQGGFDGLLTSLARTLKAFSHPVLLRFAHEMNGDWYPYAGKFAGAGYDDDGDGVPDGPENYILAWRHVHHLFARAGVANVFWVFCPNAETFPPDAWNRPFQYYPGSDYVDFIFVDAYEHSGKRLQSLAAVMEPFYNEVGNFLEARRLAGDSILKPFGLGEFGTDREDKAAKATWYTEALGGINGDARIKVHVLYNGQNGAENFSITGLGIQGVYAQPRFQFGVLESWGH